MRKCKGPLNYRAGRGHDFLIRPQRSGNNPVKRKDQEHKKSYIDEIPKYRVSLFFFHIVHKDSSYKTMPEQLNNRHQELIFLRAPLNSKLINTTINSNIRIIITANEDAIE